MARKFLYAVAIATGLVIALMLALRLWSGDLSQLAFVPDSGFQAPPPLAAQAYDSYDMWISRPGQGAQDPARWLPAGYMESAGDLDAAVFFIHPTSYMDKAQWNAPLGHGESRQQAESDVRTMAGVFNRSVDLWAPRYRQAAFGAFLTDKPDGGKAIDAAYDDILAAFDHFIARVAANKPLILAGDGQGAYHLRRLLKDRIAGTPLATRVAAVYAPGWPLSLDHDLPAMGLPACTSPSQAGCVLSWSSFAEPADPEEVAKAYALGAGLDGKPLKGSAILCSNPLTGSRGGAAPASANPGTLAAPKAGEAERLIPKAVGARCGDEGFLLIGEPLALGNRVLPGNDYRYYDYALFWSALRADASRRVEAWQAARR